MASLEDILKKLGYLRDESGNIWTLKRDENTGVIAIIDYAHHKIHVGDAFQAHLTTSDLDDNPLCISFITSNTPKWIHLFAKATVSGQAVFEVREAPTGGVVGGSELATFNRDRNSTTTTTLIRTDAASGGVTQGASAGTGGSVLLLENLGAGNNKQTGSNRGEAEWILKQNTKYFIYLSSSTNAIIATLEFDWYEHTSL